MYIYVCICIYALFHLYLSREHQNFAYNAVIASAIYMYRV